MVQVRDIVLVAVFAFCTAPTVVEGRMNYKKTSVAGAKVQGHNNNKHNGTKPEPPSFMPVLPAVNFTLPVLPVGSNQKIPKWPRDPHGSDNNGKNKAEAASNSIESAHEAIRKSLSSMSGNAKQVEVKLNSVDQTLAGPVVVGSGINSPRGLFEIHGQSNHLQQLPPVSPRSHHHNKKRSNTAAK